jgi:hypothetical protein
MWDHQHLQTLQALTACYGDIFYDTQVEMQAGEFPLDTANISSNETLQTTFEVGGDDFALNDADALMIEYNT